VTIVRSVTRSSQHPKTLGKRAGTFDGRLPGRKRPKGTAYWIIRPGERLIGRSSFCPEQAVRLESPTRKPVKPPFRL